jgi:hypothetical protein
MNILLNTRLTQSSPLSDQQIDDNWRAIMAAFAGVIPTEGTVVSVAAESFTGIDVVVNNPTTTPDIILSTTLNGFVKGNGTGLTAVSSINLVSDTSGILPITKGGTNASSYTLNRVLVYDGTRVVSSTTSTTQLGYLNNVTSDIQNQINNKQNTITVLPYSQGGTNVAAANRQVAINSLSGVSTSSPTQVLTNVAGNAVWSNSTAGGTVTSVGLSVGTSGTDISVDPTTTPITSNGTFILNIPNAGATARGVVSTGTQSFAGTKTFLSTISGDISGNAATVTNGVYTTGSYSNPSWISSLVWSKITSTPTTIAGYGITDTTSQLLTGLNTSTSGTIVSTDSILTAFGKTQNQINGLVGGVIYKGTWNASTNSPALTSSVGTQGWYYIVDVAGSTNLNGITDWKLGDWAIFNGAVWQKVDNTDAVVSVNGYTGVVTLTTSDISEGTNLYFLNSRAINSTLTGFTSSTGTITSSDTVLTSIQKLYGNMNALVTGVSSFNTRTGAITLLSTDVTGALGYTPYNSTNPSNYISLLALSATTPLNYNNTTGVFTITQSDATHNGYLSSTDWSTFNSKQDFITAGTYLEYYRGDKTWQTLNTTVVPEGTNLYFTTSRAQNAITLTTTGNSGASTYVTGALNIPNYTISGLGGVPTSRTLTIGGVTYDLSADRTWSITSSQWTTDSNGIFYNSGNVAIGYPAADAIYKFKTSGTSYFDDSIGIGVGVGVGGSSVKQVFVAGSDTGKLRLKGGTYELSLYQESGSIGYLQYATGSDFYVTNSSGWTQIYHPDRTTSIYGGLVIGYYGSPSNAALDVRADGYFQTYLTVGSLAGTGTRMVTTDATGKLGYAAIPSVSGYVPTSTTLTINGTTYDLSANRSWSVGTVTSVGLSMPSAFTVSSSPITGSGTLTVTGAGVATQYVRGDGSLANFPTNGGGGGGGAVYYFNGNTSQGTILGNAYYQLSTTGASGATANFSKTGNGLITGFITDVGQPNQTVIPAGLWSFEVYVSESGGGSNHADIYAQIEVYNGTTLTVISTSTNEQITNGGTKDLYTFAASVPQTTIASTDRIAIQFYSANTSGKTVTIYTEDSNFSCVNTTFAIGIGTLNGLTANTQYFAVGTSGSNFNISSVSETHTFNLPTASSTVRGALSTTDWTTFNSKQNALSGTGFVKISGTTISYDNSTYYLASNPNNYIALTALSSTATGLTYTNTTGVFSLTSGYVIPTTTEESNWNTAYGWGNWAAGSIYLGTSSVALNRASGAQTLNNVSITGNADTSSQVYTTFYGGSGTFNLLWTNSTASGNAAVYSSSGLLYVPSTNTISANITGNSATATLAANSTLWNNESYYGSALTPSSDITYAMVYDNTHTRFGISSASAFKTWLGDASTSTSGILTSTDWNTFNGKQNSLSGTGFVKISGTTISYDNSTYYLASNPNNYIPLTALSAGTGISYNNTTGVIASTITQYTDALARAAISLTTTGTSGAATYNSTTGVLNIPQYTDTYVGTVTSVSMSVPTGLSISGSPITTSGTLALTLTAGYVIPTTTEETNWNIAYSLSHNAVTLGTANGLSLATQVLSLGLSTTSTTGALSSTDWNTFNNKVSSQWTDDTYGVTYPYAVGIGGASSNSYKLNITGKIYASSEIVTNGDLHLTNDAYIYSSAGGAIDGMLMYGSIHNVLLKTNGTTALTIDASQNANFAGNTTIKNYLYTSANSEILAGADSGGFYFASGGTSPVLPIYIGGTNATSVQLSATTGVGVNTHTFGGYAASSRGMLAVNGSASSMIQLQIGGSTTGYLYSDTNTYLNTVNSSYSTYLQIGGSSKLTITNSDVTNNTGVFYNGGAKIADNGGGSVVINYNNGVTGSFGYCGGSSGFVFTVDSSGNGRVDGTWVVGQGVYLATTKAIQFDAGVTNDYNIYKSGTTLSFNTGGSYLFNTGNTRFASSYAEVYQTAVSSATFRFSNPTNAIQGYVGYAGSGTDMVQLYNYSGGIEFMVAGGGSAATKTTMDSNGRWGFGVAPSSSFKALFDGDIKADTLNTIQGGMANGMGAWKLGKVVTNTVSLDTTRFVEVEIDGVVIRLAVIN